MGLMECGSCTVHFSGVPYAATDQELIDNVII
jgi:hypothetical protein